LWVDNGASWPEGARLKREKLFMKAISYGLGVVIFEVMELEEGFDRGSISTPKGTRLLRR
jgi:hypothetical protein